MAQEDLQLMDTVILYDRDFGVSIFRNFRGYDSLLDDAEWLLERTTSKSQGFLMRVVIKDGARGLWIGEYLQGRNQIYRQELIFGDSAEEIAELFIDYAEGRIPEGDFLDKVKIDNLRRHLKSRIIRDFKYYGCPSDRFLYECPHVNKIYIRLVRKYGRGVKVPYSLIVKEIRLEERCNDAILCPLADSNALERILNLNRALKTRGIGEIRFVSPDFIEIH